jgi:hypothetical protein
MKAMFFCVAAVGLLSSGRAENRVLLARFELMDLAVERPVGMAAPSRGVALYRSVRGVSPLAEFVEVVTIAGEKVATRRLSAAAAGRLLDAFESAMLPDIDFQKHFDEAAKMPAEARRGIAWLPGGGGALRVMIELNTANRTARFEIWSPEVCFYSHPSDQASQVVYRLVEACSCAIGSGAVFLSSSEEPNKALGATH